MGTALAVWLKASQTKCASVIVHPIFEWCGPIRAKEPVGNVPHPRHDLRDQGREACARVISMQGAPTR